MGTFQHQVPIGNIGDNRKPLITLLKLLLDYPGNSSPTLTATDTKISHRYRKHHQLTVSF